MLLCQVQLYRLYRALIKILLNTLVYLTYKSLIRKLKSDGRRPKLGIFGVQLTLIWSTGSLQTLKSIFHALEEAIIGTSIFYIKIWVPALPCFRWCCQWPHQKHFQGASRGKMHFWGGKNPKRFPKSADFDHCFPFGGGGGASGGRASEGGSKCPHAPLDAATRRC